MARKKADEHRTGEEIAAEVEEKRRKNCERSLAYYYAHRAERMEKNRKWREEHPENCKAYRRRWYEKNMERENERSRQWNQEHPERGREIRRKYYWRHREEILEKQRVKRMNAAIEYWNNRGKDDC